MADLLGSRSRSLFDVARLKARRLRNECQTARAELKRHRAEHAPTYDETPH
jgi:hypothetical protein